MSEESSGLTTAERMELLARRDAARAERARVFRGREEVEGWTAEIKEWDANHPDRRWCVNAWVSGTQYSGERVWSGPTCEAAMDRARQFIEGDFAKNFVKVVTKHRAKERSR